MRRSDPAKTSRTDSHRGSAEKAAAINVDCIQHVFSPVKIAHK
jgi:hypothetical protein